ISLAEAKVCDLDNDGVVSEKTVGDVTAEATFLLTLAVPDRADEAVEKVLGITDLSVDRGQSLFRTPLDKGGLGCASCHTMFHKFESPVKPQFALTNPE